MWNTILLTLFVTKNDFDYPTKTTSDCDMKWFYQERLERNTTKMFSAIAIVLSYNRMDIAFCVGTIVGCQRSKTICESSQGR